VRGQPGECVLEIQVLFNPDAFGALDQDAFRADGSGWREALEGAFYFVWLKDALLMWWQGVLKALFLSSQRHTGKKIEFWSVASLRTRVGA